MLLRKVFSFNALMLLLIFLFLVVLGCICCTPKYNIKGYSTSCNFTKVQQDDNTLIFVAFSGGGTRAATMCWEVLEYLDKIPYSYVDMTGYHKTTLAREIDYISGISGGSFAATGWCVYKDSMSLFRERFVDRNIQKQLIADLFLPPWVGVKVALFKDYDRIHVAADEYDQSVFIHKTFADLPPHPVLWINATHLALGQRFTYSNEEFNLLSSNLGSYPLGYACAASSAFPILLSPITLKNYSTGIQKSEKYEMAKKNEREDIDAYYYVRKVEFEGDSTNKWIHLSDGGLVDNQGLQAILDEFNTNGIVNTRLNDAFNPLKRLVVINVNAGQEYDDQSCKKKNAPNMADVIKYTMTTSMDILSQKRWQKIQESCDEIWKVKLDDFGFKDEGLRRLEKPYCIELSFRNLPDSDLKTACNKLPTSFYLTDEQGGMIKTAVRRLVLDEPDLNRLINSLTK